MTFKSQLKFISFLTIITTVMMVFGAVNAAAPPNIITYQGRVLNANGVPVSDTSLSMKFFIYDSLTSGTCLWSNSSVDCDSNTPASTTVKTVTLTDGLFTENLGDTGGSYAAIGASIFGDDTSVFLEVIIGSETLSPRKQITAAPYAINAQLLDGIDSANFLQYDGDTATGIYDFTGAVFSGASPFVFEGSTADEYETTFAIADTTLSDKTITFPNTTGTVITTGDTGTVTGTMTVADTLNFTEFADVLSLDASSTITQDGAKTFAIVNSGTANTIINLSSTGDFVIQDNGTAALTVNDSGNTILANDLTISGDDLTMGTNTTGFILVADGTNFNPVSVSGDVSIDETGFTAIQTNAVVLSTDTSGNFVATVADAGSGHFTVSGSGSENAAVTLSVVADSLNFTEFANALSLDGAATITGTGGERFSFVRTGTSATDEAGVLIDFTGATSAANTDYIGLQISIDTGASLSATDTITAITIDNLTNSSQQATETAVVIGTGWDAGMSLGSGMEINWVDTNESISGDGTDLTLQSGADIHLNATADVNLPVNIGLTFGDDGEKIEGDGTDMTIASSNNLTVTTTNDFIVDAVNFDLAATGLMTFTPTTALGTMVDFVLETEWTTGTLINADFAGATTSTGNMTGLLLDFGSNVTVANGNNQTLIDLETDGGTYSGTGTEVLTGINIDADAAIVQDTAAGVVTWRGASFTLPDITQTTGTVTSTGILITGGTVTSGDQIGIDMGGTKLDLDADNDTSITADTDDQIDIEISGADDFQFTANTFSVLAGSSLAFVDDADATFGSSASFRWETADANANAFHLVLPNGDGTDVPVFAIGDASMTGDLGLFNGITDNTLAVVSDDAGDYFSVSVADTGISTLKSNVGDITFNLAVAQDINIGANIGLTFGDDGEKIEGDGTDLTINSGGTINLDATGGLTTSSSTFTADGSFQITTAAGAFEVDLTGGAGLASAGGAIDINAGAGATNFGGGEVTINAGDGDGTGNGGGITITSGASVGGASGDAGDIAIVAANVTSTNGVGGDITIDAGNGNGAGATSDGGDITLIAGDVAAGAAQAGSVFLATGSDAGGAVEGNIVLTINGGTDAGENGGDIAIEALDDFLVETTDDVDFDIGGDFLVNSTNIIFTTTNTIDLDAGAGITTNSSTLTADGSFQITTVAGAFEVDLTGGTGTGGSAGGAIDINAGAGNGIGSGGAVTINSGNGGATNAAGGEITITAGNGGATNAPGGDITFTSGTGAGTGDGGLFIIGSGQSGTGATGNGGSIEIAAASSVATVGNGGNILIQSGLATGGGTNGTIDLEGTVTIDGASTLALNEVLCHDGGAGDGVAINDGKLADCAAAGQADYAEQYPVTVGITFGDLVTTGTKKITTKDGDTIAQLIKASGAYKDPVVGIVSNNYGNFTSAGYNIKEEDNPMPVALSGRVLVNVTNENGTIQTGDPITTSSTPGFGMKSTEAGMIVGFALNDFSGASGQVMVFVRSSWYAGDVIGTDGSSTVLSDKVVVAPLSTATNDNQSVDSYGFALRGSSWNGVEAKAVEMIISNTVTDSSNYRLSISDTAGSEVAYITNSGTMRIAGDMVVSGYIYPSDRGVAQTNKYIYYDGSSGPAGDFMRTNSKGWSTGSYDFAEMFPSENTLEPGDVVAFSGNGSKVELAKNGRKNAIAGIISTRPGFLAGENTEGSYPVALVGRVPTKVNLENGNIEVGDAIIPSSVPGYAMKAIKSGQIVGYALEPFKGGTDKSILAFVNAGHWNGSSVEAAPGTNTNTSKVASVSSTSSTLTMNGNIFMLGNQILSIGKLEGIGNTWSIENDGTLKTTGELMVVTKSHQGTDVVTKAITSTESIITLSGTNKTSDGTAEVRFEKVSPEFNDVISADAPIRVIVTASGPVSLYVSEKDQNHFVVKRFGSSSIDTEFDWMVTAYRKGYEPDGAEDIIESEDEVTVEPTATDAIREQEVEEVGGDIIKEELVKGTEEVISEEIEQIINETVVIEEPASLLSIELNIIDQTLEDEGGAIAESPSQEAVETPSPVQEDIVQ